jgi:hypothetical protein
MSEQFDGPTYLNGQPKRKRPSRPNAGRFQLRRNTREGKGGGAHSIRGYQWIYLKGGNALLATNLFSALYPDHPSAFKWKKAGPQPDFGALGRFIDAIYTGNVAAVNAEVENGNAFDLEYRPPDNTPQELFSLRLPQLLSIMSLKAEVSLPLWGRIAFITDGKNLVPAEMLTMFAALAPHLFEAPPPGKAKWREISTEGDLWRTLKLRPEQVTTSLYRNHGPVGGLKGPQPLSEADLAAQDAVSPGVRIDPAWRVAEPAAAAPVVEDPPPEPDAETPIARNEGHGYVELVTQVKSKPRSHYARRILAKGRVIYAATSWSLDGPWHVWERDTAAMLGLGLS